MNDKVYVGQTTKPIEERFQEHCTSHVSKLGKAIERIGKEHFSITVLDDSCKNLDELAECEALYISKYNSIERGYNARPACKSNGVIAGGKIKLTTMVDADLLQWVKIQAIKEKRSVSDLLEELIKQKKDSLEAGSDTTTPA